MENGNCSKTEIFDCAICLQKCIYPTRISCGHIFCYLCVKGIRNRLCAICRHEITDKDVTNPTLLESIEKSVDSDWKWFYEGTNGWWQYDERTADELERAYQAKQLSCKVLVAGYLYFCDFRLMMQYRCTDLTIFRRIKRDVATAPKKGIAGIKL